jgi:hypothetical protein
MGLQAGCCPDPALADPSAARRHLIRGRHFKPARDAEGNHLDGGVIRDTPWIAIPPVVPTMITGTCSRRADGPGTTLT